MMTAAQARAARAGLKLTLQQVGEEAGVAKNTVARLEGGGAITGANEEAIRRAYERLGIVFLDGAGEDFPGLRIPPR